MVSGMAERMLEVSLGQSDAVYDLQLHISGSDAVIEILPSFQPQRRAADPIVLVKSMVGRLKRAPTMERFFALAASQVRAVTAFDRVMIYRFLDEGGGEVVAEALRAGLTPFMGLRYPASDIPAQAQALYRRQCLRVVPDAEYTPVPLIGSGARVVDVDLSLATLRSVSPIHVEYLRNMGSRATLTVSLLEGDRLWGFHRLPSCLAPPRLIGGLRHERTLRPDLVAANRSENAGSGAGRGDNGPRRPRPPARRHDRRYDFR